MMKLATHDLTLCLLLISICTAAATEESSSSEAVVDIDGDEVKTGVEYYMASPLGEYGSYFSVASTGCNPCRSTLDVVLLESSSSLNLGLPVTFLPMNNHKPGSVVRDSTHLNIKFNATSIKPTCTDAESRVWNLEHDRCINRSIVTTGGTGVNGWFKFEKVYQFIYKIVSCPNSCGDLAYPADELNSPQKHLRISSSAPSNTEYIFWVLIVKANNYTQAPNNLIMNIKGILTSTH